MNGFMAKVTEFKTLKKRQARRRGLGLLVLTALVLVGAYLLSALVNTPNFAGLSSVLDMIQGGPGYPIDAPGGKVKGMYQNGSSLVVVNETTIYFYNTSGSEVYSAQHRMGNPQVATNGTMLLNFDRGSKTYTAYSRNNQFYTGTTETAIRCGDISANGCIAIATQSENAHSQVQVMDNKQRLQYTWSSDDVITAMAISDNGSMVAIGSSYVEEGELKNSLTVLRGGEELYKYTLANQLILGLEFDGNNVRCVTDRSALLLDTNGKAIGQFDYKGQPLSGFSMYDNGLALVFGNYEQDRSYTLASVADNFFTLRGTATLTDSVQKIEAYENTILVLGGSSLREYSAYDCSLVGEESEGSYYNFEPMGNSIYAITGTEIVRLTLAEPSRFSLFTNHTPQELPDGETEQTQEELDLLENILSGFNKDKQNQTAEPTIGQSTESDSKYEEGFIESEQPQTTTEPETETTPETPAVGEDFDPDNPDGLTNTAPSHMPVQNEDAEPEFSNEDDLNQSQQQEQEKEQQEQTQSQEEQEEQQEEGQLFSSRRPAS